MPGYTKWAVLSLSLPGLAALGIVSSHGVLETIAYGIAFVLTTALSVAFWTRTA
jgi:hypothetical protein